MNIPRIPKNKGFLGPEWFACCNTGRRPAMFHSLNGKWIVGPELSARGVLEQHLHYELKRRHTIMGASVLVCKTRVSAVHEFNKLCAEVEKYNEVQKSEYIKARQAARKGDLAAALSLGDY